MNAQASETNRADHCCHEHRFRAAPALEAASGVLTFIFRASPAWQVVLFPCATRDHELPEKLSWCARLLSELGVWVCGGYYDRGAFHCLVLAGELSSIITHHVMISIWRWIEPPHLTISHQRGMTLPMSASPHSRSSQTPAPHLPNANEAELPPLRCHENGSSALEIPSAFLSRYSIQPALSAFPLHQA